MKKYRTLNPATEKEESTYEVLNRDELENVLAKAHQSFLRWSGETFEKRGAYFKKLADLLENNSMELGKVISIEMGKPVKQSRSEVEKCAWVCRFYADKASEILADQPIKTDSGKSFISFEPLGVIYGVMPWNFPFWQVFRYAVPSLMAGNTTLMKHAENVPRCALEIENLFKKAGFPGHVFNTIFIDHKLSDEIISDSRIRGVTLTGSNAAGSKVAGKAGESLKKTVLELGGSDPFIVLQDADIEKAAETAVKARFQNTGQSCIAAKRFIIHEKVYDDFVKKFKTEVENLKLGDPMEEITFIGPLARKDLLEKLKEQVENSVKKGAQVLTGGKSADIIGYYYLPTLLENIPKDSPAYNEEIFGPVASLFKVKDEAEAILIANDNKYGLGASLWTSDLKKAKRLARKIESGNVFINDMVKSDPRLPFGGVKESGFGRELSEYGIKEFVNIKTVNVS